MAKLTVIHISDIHVKGELDGCFRHAADIARSCFSHARDADACLLAITGDVAFAGTASQYQLSLSKLIQPIVSGLETETRRPVYVSITPGNHDCVLIPPDEVRAAIVQSVVEDPGKAESEAFVEACTGVQQNFFCFLKEAANPPVQLKSKLFWQQHVEVGNKSVSISSLNAAWMSTLEERQGNLVYPVGRFDGYLVTSACVHLALVHHPFNWYEQAAYQQLRSRLRRSCTAVLSGHEHVGNAGKIEDHLSGSSLFFEAAALQPHDAKVTAGFSVYQLDLDKKEVCISPFEILQTGVQVRGDTILRNWSDDGLIHGALDIEKKFSASLSDPGGNFTHASRERLTLEDVFVWPDVRSNEGDNRAERTVKSSRLLVGSLEQGERFVVYGDDKAGKSTLLRWCFRELVSLGYAPLHCEAAETNIRDEDDARRRLDQLVKNQYKNPDEIARFPREKRILLVDDVDRLKSGLRNLKHFLDFADKHFSGIVLTAGSDFEVTNLASKDAALAMAGFRSYELMRFGLKLRYQLIQKWCSLGVVNSKTELDRRVDEVESIVNSVIGKRLVPEHPLYLLILLQSCEQHRHGEIQNSGLSFYYQYLITKSLGEWGVKPIELDEHFNYLSMLAWKFREYGLKELDRTQIAIMNSEFSRRFVTVDLDGRLELLVSARILSKRGDCYSFAYPYIYYFFTGRYLARNLDNPEIKAWVEDSCKKLYLHDRAHAVMFLTHHTENKWVIKLICQVIQECFSDKKPIELDKDIGFFNALVEKSSQLTLAAPDVERNQVAVREAQDKILEGEVDRETEEDDLLSFTSKWNLLHKTSEILGLILKNYYGSLERADKQQMIRDVCDGPLRALRLWSEEVANDLESYVKHLKDDELKRNKNLSEETAEKRVKRRLFNVIGIVATNVVAAAATAVSSEKLRDDVMSVVDENPTNAYKLIAIACRLLKPGTVPIEAVKKLARELEHNPYAFEVLQNLGFVHMYMFHTEEIMKQSLSQTLQISFAAAKAIEVKKSGRLLK